MDIKITWDSDGFEREGWCWQDLDGDDGARPLPGDLGQGASDDELCDAVGDLPVVRECGEGLEIDIDRRPRILGQVAS